MPAKGEEKEEEKEVQDEIYDVEAILKSRIYKGKKQYLIKWLGYPSSANTWEDEENVFCDELKKEFEEKKRLAQMPKKAEREEANFQQQVTNEWAGIVKKILGVAKNRDGTYEVEFLTCDGKRIHCAAEEMHVKAPISLLKFYEDHLTFTE